MYIELSFEHLYDNRCGCIQKVRKKWEHPTIIFPFDFIPETGKKYSCVIECTNAVFVYNNILYRVSSAYLEDRASFMEEIDYKLKKQEPEKTTMQLAFENAGKG